MSLYSVLTAPGLEAITQQELEALGLSRSDDPPLRFRGDQDAMYRANLHLRTATRVLCNVGMPFFARSFDELLTRISHLPWERFLTPGEFYSLRVKSRGSRLYHEEAIAERLAVFLHSRFGAVRQKGSDTETEQRIYVDMTDDRCMVSMDSSGNPLHRRGYRLETAKAPLREDLAAAMLLAVGFDGTTPLIDPFCGSGTIAIEGALISAHIPPGLLREDFSFTRWPGFDEAHWKKLRNQAMPLSQARRSSGQIPAITASDRDAGAVRIAHVNAGRAGVADLIAFSCQAVSALKTHQIQPAGIPGHIVTNPPYGQRISKTGDLRNLYAQLGKVLRTAFPGWHFAILSSDPALLGHTGLQQDLSITFGHGGLKVILARGVVH